MQLEVELNGFGLGSCSPLAFLVIPALSTLIINLPRNLLRHSIENHTIPSPIQ